jgi:pectate lyase
MKANHVGRFLFKIAIFLLIVATIAGCIPAQTATAPVPTEPVTVIPVSTATSAPNAKVVPAFPGAQGFGFRSAGGRGGEVVEVVNLNDDGPGSFRSAIESEGPRIVVFRVAGTIDLQSSLVISNPFITIAGQTAPGDGVTLRAISADAEALIQIKTHDVVVRYLTLRAGPPSAGDAILILADETHDTYNVVIDHNSISWAVNRNLATWYDVHEITIQWNIFSEGLDCSIHPKGCHSKGVLIGGYASDENKDKPGAYNISLHHNLMAHNGERNPYIEAAGVIDVVNNVAYNPFGAFSHIDMVYQLAQDQVNYIGNFYKPGPDTEVKYGIKAINPGTPGAGIFVQGNLGPQREDDSLPEIEIVDLESRGFVVSEPFPAEAITTTTAVEAYEQVLKNAGAGIGLDCEGNFFSRRDVIDTRVINEVQSGTGNVIDDPSEVGGWLAIDSALPCADSDHDGMPDAWEQMFGFDLNDPAEASKDANGNGYTNIEEFLNGTNPVQ